MMGRIIKIILTIMIISFFFLLSNAAETVSEDNLIILLGKAKTDTERISVVQQLGPVGTVKSVNRLAGILKNGESSKLRMSAASVLGEIRLKNNETSRIALELSFKTDDKYVRENAIKSLSKIGSSKSVPVFLEGYESNTGMEIKYWAIIGLSGNGNKKYRKLYIDAIGKTWENPGAREAAIEALGRYGIKPDWNIIKPYSRSNTSSVVIASLRAAGYLKNLDSLGTIEMHLANSDPAVAEAALEALGSFDGKYAIPLFIRFKAANPDNILTGKIKTILKKLKAASQYAILKSNMILRVKPTERSNKKKVIMKNSIVIIISKGNRRYIITDSTGDVEDFWYMVRDLEGHSGYLYGGYLTIVNSYD